MKSFAFGWLLFFGFQVISAKLNSGASISKSHQENHENTRKYLLVSSTASEPFMYQNGSGKFYDGIEYKLIKTIAEKEKLKLFIQNQPNALTFDKIKAENLNYDIFAGGLFPNATFFDYLQQSKVYYQDDMTWCVKKASYVHYLLNIFFVATPEVWIILIFGIGYTAGFLLYLMVQFDLKYENRNQRDWHYTTLMIALPTVIGVNTRFHPKSTSLRIFHCFFLLACFALWQIILFVFVDFIKIPVLKHQISTTAEIIDWEYRLAGSTEVLGLTSFDDRYKKSQIDSFFVCSSIDSCLDHLKHDDNDYLAVGGSRQRILNSRSYSPTKIYCFEREESIVSYQLSLFMRQDFDLEGKINKIIWNAFESGLFVKWDRDSQRKKERIVPYTPEPAFTFKEGSPAIVFLLSIGSVMATSALFLEILVDRKLKHGYNNKIWLYLEQFFDGKRYYFKNVPEKLMAKSRNRRKIARRNYVKGKRASELKK